MRAALLAATMLCGLGTAEAAVFDLTGQTYNAEAQFRRAMVSFRLVISDAAVARGSFNLQESALSQIVSVTGDMADFVSASTGPVAASGQTVTPTSAWFASVNFALTFAGSIASGTINFLGESDAIQLAGTGGTFSGLFGSDFKQLPEHWTQRLRRRRAAYGVRIPCPRTGQHEPTRDGPAGLGSRPQAPCYLGCGDDEAKSSRAVECPADAIAKAAGCFVPSAQYGPGYKADDGP